MHNWTEFSADRSETGSTPELYQRLIPQMTKVALRTQKSPMRDAWFCEEEVPVSLLLDYEREWETKYEAPFRHTVKPQRAFISKA